MIEISITFAKNILNLFCFVLFLLFDLRIVEKEKCGKRFEICLFVTIGEIRERKNERKVRFFAFVKLDETPSRLDWLNG